MTSSNLCNKCSSPERSVEPRDISWLYGCLHEDPRRFLFLYLRREYPHEPRLYATWLCYLNGYNDTLYILYVRILMKFCKPAFLETITGSLTCGNASATGAIMDELG